MKILIEDLNDLKKACDLILERWELHRPIYVSKYIVNFEKDTYKISFFLNYEKMRLKLKLNDYILVHEYPSYQCEVLES